MTISYITNRLGKLYFSTANLPAGTDSVIDFFHSQNEFINSESDLVFIVECAQEEENLCVSADAMNTAVAIFLNAKNYLIYDDDAESLLNDIKSLGIDIYLDCHNTFSPVGLNNLVMTFIPNQGD